MARLATAAPPEPARAARSHLSRRRLARSVQAALAALWLVACAPPAAEDIAGRYEHEGPIAATLEVRAEAGRYVVRLEGGGSTAAGAASAADCVVEARGELDGAVLRAAFGPVKTDTFSYSAAAARREGRMVAIAFDPGAAEVIEAATVGYCGWGVDFSGRYRAVGSPQPWWGEDAQARRAPADQGGHAGPAVDRIWRGCRDPASFCSGVVVPGPVSG